MCNKWPATDPVAIHTPSGSILHSTHEVEIDVPGLPAVTGHGYIVPHLVTQPLLSVSQLCDASCKMAFTADTITISHNQAIIMTGHYTATSKQWELDICPLMHHANAAIGSATPANLVVFAHATMFSPTLSTLTAVLQCSHLPEYASLTLKQLQQHSLQSAAMIKGHMDQTQLNQQSTQTMATTEKDAMSNQCPPALEDGASCTIAMLHSWNP